MKSKSVKMLERLLGTKDLNTLTDSQNDKLVELIYEDQIPIKTFATVIKYYPVVVKSLCGFIDSVSASITNNAEIKRESIATLNNISTLSLALVERIDTCETDKCRIQISKDVKDIVFKLCSTMESINKKKSIIDLISEHPIFVSAVFLGGLLLGRYSKR